jgi:cell division protein FtsB
LILKMRTRVAGGRERLRAAARCRLQAAQEFVLHALVSAVERARRWRRRVATTAVVALAAFIAFHTVAGENGLLVYREKRAEARRLEQEIEALRLHNEHLGREIRSLRADPRAIEREARERFGYTRPGEVVYILPAPPAAPSAEPPATAERR